MLGSSGMFHPWALAVFLLCSPVPLYGRPIAALSHRTRRSVSHAQLMHDKGRALQEFKRRLWLQELLDQVHTAGEPPPPPPPNRHAHGGTTLRQKPPGGSKHLPLAFGLDGEGEGGNLPQETSVWAARKDQPLKPPAKRKKKVKSGRRREGEKRRRRARSVRGRESEKRRRRARSVGRREGEKPRRRARSVGRREGEKPRRRARSVGRREGEKPRRRARSVGRREGEKRRRRARSLSSVSSLRTQESVRTRGLGSQTGCGLGSQTGCGLRAALH